MARAAAFIAGEGNWLPMAMTAAMISGALLYFRAAAVNHHARVMATMNLFVGVMLAFMGIGHVLAVTVKFMDGTLRGSPLLLYVIGAAIVLPSTLIVGHTGRLAADTYRAKAVKLHGWMAATLILLGLINTPLAIPALLSMAYAAHTRRATGVAIVSAFALVNAGLFIGGLMFLLSGAQTFEQFSNMP
jgi:hypothetical protein